MINIIGLYCGTATLREALKDGEETAVMVSPLPRSSEIRKPVVVWECTRRCNLRGSYGGVEERPSPNELATDEAKALVQDLARFGVPVLEFAGGEPLLREDIFDLARLAASLGIHPVLSTNGTLISKGVARDLRRFGFDYVEIGLEGLEASNDRFREKKGAFAEAMEGFRYCVEAGQRVGIGFTLAQHSLGDLVPALEFVEHEGIERVRFGHLVYDKHDSQTRKDALTHEDTRQALDTIIDHAAEFHRRGLEKDILTADNDADGVHLYLRMVRERSDRAEEVRRLLRWQGGNGAGVGIGAIDDEGYVHADRFWRHHSLGNVRDRPFSEIWMDGSDQVLVGLRDRKPLLKGRCGWCSHQDLCNGSSRVRAEAVHGDRWEEDPACYLTERELASQAQGTRT